MCVTHTQTNKANPSYMCDTRESHCNEYITKDDVSESKHDRTDNGPATCFDHHFLCDRNNKMQTRETMMRKGTHVKHDGRTTLCPCLLYGRSGYVTGSFIPVKELQSIESRKIN